MIGSENNASKNAVPADIEQRLLSLCGQVLGIETVTAQDNFFELGGDSLSAMWLLSSIQEEFAIEIPLTLVFDVDTIAGVAKVVEGQLSAAGQTAVPASGSEGLEG